SDLTGSDQEYGVGASLLTSPAYSNCAFNSECRAGGANPIILDVCVADSTTARVEDGSALASRMISSHSRTTRVLQSSPRSSLRRCSPSSTLLRIWCSHENVKFGRRGP